MTPSGRIRRALSRIWIRLLAFNVLLVFVPLVALSYLDTYELQLLEHQERSMVQQGRLVAAALGGGGELDAATVHRMLERLRSRTTARIRVLDRDAMLLGDTSTLGPKSERPVGVEEATGTPAPRETWLYRVGALPFRLWSRATSPQPAPETEFYAADRAFDGDEIRAALKGRYGAATRISEGGQRSVTLYSAIPILADDAIDAASPDINGVALVTQSTFQILQDLHELRLDLFRIFLLSLAAAIVLSLMVSTTIVRPIRRLRREAASLLDSRGRLTGLFGRTEQRDEVGELGRDLRELARRLREQQESSESFAADLAHEFRNPLASIRGATEVLAELEDPDERRRFVAMIESDTARLERLLAGVRELSSIDAGREESHEAPVDLATLVPELVAGWKQRHGNGAAVTCTVAAAPLPVDASPDRLAQVLENLLENARGFSPPGAPIDVSVGAQNGQIALTVRDHGPGIPPENHARIFDRFFTYRPNGSKTRHSGLGLAIVKAIVESRGGSVAADEPEGGGTKVSVLLRRADR